MEKYIKYPFAENGNIEEIPNDTTEDGTVSFNQGYGTKYALNPKIDPNAKNIERTKMNYLFNILSSNIKQYQEIGFPEWIADKGDGNPFAYQKDVIVKYTDNKFYMSKIDSNTYLPTSATYWIEFKFELFQYLSGITSNVQTQIDGKQATINDYSLPITKLDVSGATDIGTGLADTDLVIVNNKKSAVSRIFTYISSKLTGAISTVLTSNLTANKALLSDGSGKIAVSNITNTELTYLAGLSSNLQTQLDSKVTKNANILAGTFTKITYDAKGLVLSGSNLSAIDIPYLDASKITSGILPIVYGGTGNNGINPMIKGLINNYCTANQLNGTESATNALRTALSENNIVYVLGGTKLYIDATGGQILIPEGKAIIGLTGTGMQPNRSGYTSGANTAEIRILNTGSAGIQLNNNIRLENISIVSYSNITTQATPTTFAGIGLITPGIVCSNVYLNRVGIYGFNKGIDIATNGGVLGGTGSTRGNWHITDCQFDNTTDISTGFVFDTIYVSRCHSYPFMGNAVIGTDIGTPRSAFIDCANEYNDWLQVDHCFSHSNRKMIANYFSGTCTGGGYDFEDYSLPTDYNNPLNIGIHCKVGSNNRGLATISGVRFNGGQVHIRGYFNNNDNNISQINVSGCTHERVTYTFIEAVDVDAIVGGGVINVVGMITGKNTGDTAVTPQYIFYATGTSKINVTGWTACPVSISEKGINGTAVITDIGRMAL